MGKAELTLVKQQPITLSQKSSTAYIKISTGQSGGGLSNSGYWGIPVQADQEYQLSVIIQSESAESAANEVLNCVSKLCTLSMTALRHQVSQTSSCQSMLVVICHSSSAYINHLSGEKLSPGQQPACRSMDCLPTTHKSFFLLAPALPVLQALQVTATLKSQDGSIVYASADIGDISSAWSHPKIMLTSNGTDPSAQLTLYINGAADVSLRMVSLWPAQNVKGEVLQPFRPDLLQYLKDLKPRCCQSLFAFIQLAHSCISCACICLQC